MGIEEFYDKCMELHRDGKTRKEIAAILGFESEMDLKVALATAATQRANSVVSKKKGIDNYLEGTVLEVPTKNAKIAE